MTFPVWVTIAKAVAESAPGQYIRRWLAKRSAKELRRRKREKEIADIASYHDKHYGVQAHALVDVAGACRGVQRTAPKRTDRGQ